MSRTIYGARTAVEVVFLALIFSIAIGVPLGLVSGYVGGWLDRILVLINDALFAFPYLLLAIVAAFLLSDTIDSGIVVTAIAITVVYVPQYFRVVRASTLSARESTYIEAARAMGAQPRTIIRRYLFGNVDPERAGDRDAERRRRDPDARRPRLPRPRHPAQRGGGVGLRPPARDRRRRRRHLVDGAVPGPRHRARRDRADARRRGPQRRAQPDAAAAPDRQADVHRREIGSSSVGPASAPEAERDAGY